MSEGEPGGACGVVPSTIPGTLCDVADMKRQDSDGKSSSKSFDGSSNTSLAEFVLPESLPSQTSAGSLADLLPAPENTTAANARSLAMGKGLPALSRGPVIDVTGDALSKSPQTGGLVPSTPPEGKKSMQLEAVLQRLQEQLEALCEMPKQLQFQQKQLQALQNLPGQVTALSTSLGSLKVVMSQQAAKQESTIAHSSSLPPRVRQSVSASAPSSGPQLSPSDAQTHSALKRRTSMRGAAAPFSSIITGTQFNAMRNLGGMPESGSPYMSTAEGTNDEESQSGQTAGSREVPATSSDLQASSPGGSRPSVAKPISLESLLNAAPKESNLQLPVPKRHEERTPSDGSDNSAAVVYRINAPTPPPVSSVRQSVKSNGDSFMARGSLSSRLSTASFFKSGQNLLNRLSMRSIISGAPNLHGIGENGQVLPIEEIPSVLQAFKTASNSKLDCDGGKALALARSASRSDLSGAESTQRCTTMAPNSPIRMAWDSIIVVNTFLAGILMPLLVVYFEDEPYPAVLDVMLLYVVDLLWSIDIVMNFRTGYVMRDGEIEENAWKIAAHYAHGWLLLDLVSAWPLFVTSKESTAYVVACLVKLPRLLQLGPRLTKLRTAISGNGWLAVYILTAGALATHMMACTWRLCMRNDGTPKDAHEDVFTRYVADFYFVIVSLVSVGYGDIVPLGSISRLYAVLVIMVGNAVFGAMISGCSYLFQKLVNNEAEKRIAELNRFMSRRSVPKSLQRRVRENLRQHLIYSESTIMTPHLLASLSPAMQRELCLSILSETVNRFPLFKNAQRSFVAELAQAHCWEQVLAGDLVTDEGQGVHEIVFVMEGSLHASVCGAYDGQIDVHISDLSAQARQAKTRHTYSGEMLEEDEEEGEDSTIEMRAGAWFGEASLFDDERVYAAAIAAITKCELAVLPAAEYCKVVTKYPYLLERHNNIKKALVASHITLTDLKCKDFAPLQGAVGAAYSIFGMNIGRKQSNFNGMS